MSGTDHSIGEGGTSESAARRRPDPARARKVLLGLVGVAGLTGGAWFLHHHFLGQYLQTTNNAYVQAETVTVAPKISGYVEQVFVENNQEVRTGQPLVKIDPRSYGAEVEQFRAQVAIAEASAQAVEAQIDEQAAAVSRARTEVSAAESDAAFARGEVNRYRPLVEAGAETREHLDQLRQQASQSSSKLAGAKASLLSAERRVQTLQAQVRQHRAQGEAAKAQLSSAELDVSASLIRASQDGRIGDRSVRVGQYVQAATRLMSIVPARDVFIDANFKETQLGRMRVGQPVKVAIDALPDIEIPGEIVSISPATGSQFSILPPQNATGNFTKIVQRVPVRVRLRLSPKAKALIVPGMSAEVTVDTRSAKKDTDAVRKAQQHLNDQADR